MSNSKENMKEMLDKLASGEVKIKFIKQPSKDGDNPLINADKRFYKLVTETESEDNTISSIIAKMDKVMGEKLREFKSNNDTGKSESKALDKTKVLIVGEGNHVGSIGYNEIIKMIDSGKATVVPLFGDILAKKPASEGVKNRASQSIVDFFKKQQEEILRDNQQKFFGIDKDFLLNLPKDLFNKPLSDEAFNFPNIKQTTKPLADVLIPIKSCNITNKNSENMATQITITDEQFSEIVYQILLDNKGKKFNLTDVNVAFLPALNDAINSINCETKTHVGGMADVCENLLSPASYKNKFIINPLHRSFDTIEAYDLGFLYQDNSEPISLMSMINDINMYRISTTDNDDSSIITDFLNNNVYKNRANFTNALYKHFVDIICDNSINKIYSLRDFKKSWQMDCLIDLIVNFNSDEMTISNGVDGYKLTELLYDKSKEFGFRIVDEMVDGERHLIAEIVDFKALDLVDSKCDSLLVEVAEYMFYDELNETKFIDELDINDDDDNLPSKDSKSYVEFVKKYLEERYSFKIEQHGNRISGIVKYPNNKNYSFVWFVDEDVDNVDKITLYENGNSVMKGTFYNLNQLTTSLHVIGVNLVK